MTQVCVKVSLSKMNVVLCECTCNAHVPVFVLKAQLGGKNSGALESELKCITGIYQYYFYQSTLITCSVLITGQEIYLCNVTQ